MAGLDDIDHIIDLAEDLIAILQGKGRIDAPGME